MHILLGPYELIVEKIGVEQDLVISLELVHPLPTTDEQLIRKPLPMSLEDTGFSKRKLTLWLAIIATIVFLVAPLIASFSIKAQSIMGSFGIYPKGMWDVGSVEPSHRSFVARCAACHQSLLHSVKDESCLACHKETMDHLENTESNKHLLKKIKCTQCHREHQAWQPEKTYADGVCTDCHGDLKQIKPNSITKNIHDFGMDHPEFRLSFRVGEMPSDIRRILQGTTSSKIQENSYLKFPHDQHIGLVQVPWNMSDIRDIKCRDCHEENTDGLGFKPISMKLHCFECHQDQLDINLEPKGRRLPHGSVVELTNEVHDYYSGLAFKNKKNADWISERLHNVIKSLSNGGCDYCHTVLPGENGNLLEITPLKLTNKWFPATKFPHSKHHASACAECHTTIEKSSQSTDLDIPDIRSCRKCHAGSSPDGIRLSTNCVSCHSFHREKKKK